jgi:deoxyribonuclease-4
MVYSSLNFGTAGIPIATPERSTENGIKYVSKLGLSAMELEFVHGITVRGEKAEQVKKIANNLGVELTCHGSYYINLNSLESYKQDASIERIFGDARAAFNAGVKSLTFHPGFYLKSTSVQAASKIKSAFEKISAQLKSEGTNILLRPETTGKQSQFGTIEELIELSAQVDGVLPCIDFAHLHARSNGKVNSFEEFSAILEKCEKRLGKDFLKNLHCHVSGINYGEKGEKNHLILKESDFNYTALLKAFKHFNCKGVVINESPNIESDALLLQKTFKEI